MKILNSVFFVMLSLVSFTLPASRAEKEGVLLKFSDGRASLSDLAAINDVLKTVGVRLNRIELPIAARALLGASAKAPLSHEQAYPAPGDILYVAPGCAGAGSRRGTGARHSWGRQHEQWRSRRPTVPKGL